MLPLDLSGDVVVVRRDRKRSSAAMSSLFKGEALMSDSSCRVARSKQRIDASSTLSFPRLRDDLNASYLSRPRNTALDAIYCQLLLAVLLLC